MTTPATDESITGSTRDDVLQLALSGHLAAASGGENHIDPTLAEQVVGETLAVALTDARAQAAELEAQQAAEAAAAATAPPEAPAPASAPAASSTASATPSASSGAQSAP